MLVRLSDLLPACELIIEWFGTEKIVAKGQVYPAIGGILHGLPIEPGFVKVQVDSVEEGCSAFPVARPTDEVKTLHDALGGQFIQWPQKYIRVSKKISSHKSMSHPSSNGPSRYQNACARVRHTPINEPVPSQAPLTGHCHQQMIHVASPDGMYDKTFYESVEYESLLGWMTNDWIDGTILHWWCMHLFEMERKEEFNTCAFFNPTIIQGHVCDQESNFVIKHILATVEAHKEKEIFLAPYLQEYFSLGLIFNLPYDKDGIHIRFIQTRQENDLKQFLSEQHSGKCNQQVALWECGYYVMKFVFETLYIKQKPSRVRALRKDELDGINNQCGIKVFPGILQ
ncbi:ulp1 protease family, C-terminal catalytic domain-containing protein [Tanacetum coccineum]